jgi:hypothetical protein
MEDKDYLSAKTIFSLSGSSAACVMLVGLLEKANLHINQVVVVMIFATIISFIALFSDKKKRKTAKIYLVAFINAMLITSTSLGVNTANNYFPDKEDAKTEEVKKSSLIPFLGNEIWLPPAKLKDEIKIKSDSLSEAKIDFDIIASKDTNQTKLIAELKTSSNTDLVFSSRLKEAKELEKKAYDDFYKGDFKSSMIKFKRVDEIYPTYHSAFEIYSYLKKNENNFESKKDEIKKTVDNKWKDPNPKDSIKVKSTAQQKTDPVKVVTPVKPINVKPPVKKIADTSLKKINDLKKKKVNKDD